MFFYIHDEENENILKNAGYDGYLSVEFEGMEECLPAIKSGLEYLKAIV